jgi:hypothetical protein
MGSDLLLFLSRLPSTWAVPRAIPVIVAEGGGERGGDEFLGRSAKGVLLYFHVRFSSNRLINCTTLVYKTRIPLSFFAWMWCTKRGGRKRAEIPTIKHYSIVGLIR